MIYYLKDYTSDLYNAGYKARFDIYQILKSRDYKDILIYDNSNSKIIKFLQLFKFFIYAFFKLKRKDILIIQFPYIRITYKLLSILKKIKKFKVLVFIHDIELLRTLNKKYKCEIKYLIKQDYLISHNNEMENFLISNNIPKDKIYNLSCFDYLTNSIPNLNKEYDICFAGALNKSQFIYKYDPKNITISYFGSGLINKLPKNATYIGVYNADEIVAKLNGKFGLIWDGTEVTTCDSNVGKYMKYNNPHKMSLYIASSTPVICWSESAIAKFVIDNKIGIVIDSLEKLDEVIPSISDEEYTILFNNISKLRNKVIKGYFTNNALDTFLK